VHSVDSYGVDLKVQIHVIVICVDTFVNSPHAWQEFRNCLYFNMSAQNCEGIISVGVSENCL